MTNYVKVVHKIAEFVQTTKYMVKDVNNANLGFI